MDGRTRGEANVLGVAYPEGCVRAVGLGRLPQTVWCVCVCVSVRIRDCARVRLYMCLWVCVYIVFYVAAGGAAAVADADADVGGRYFYTSRIRLVCNVARRS